MTPFVLKTSKKNFYMDLIAKSYLFEFFFDLGNDRFIVNTDLDKDDIKSLFAPDSIIEAKTEHELDVILDKISKCGIELLTESEMNYLNNYK